MARAESRKQACRRRVCVVVIAFGISAPRAAVAAPGPASPNAGSSVPSQARPVPARHPAVLLPTLVADGGVTRLPSQNEPELSLLASGLDALLTDTAQDLGLAVDLSARAGSGGSRDERDLAARANAIGGMLLSPSIRLEDSRIEIRLVLANAASKSLLVRVELTSRQELHVRAAVMLRDLVVEAGKSASHRSAVQDHGRPVQGTLASPASSSGRIVLGVNATLFGGMLGYSIQRASGSEDPRLLYPLLALGAGVGLGGSIIAAEEWDVGVGDAWFLSAGAWWPTVAGQLIYAGRFGTDPHAETERWSAGLIGGTTGLAVATLGLALGHMSDGGALLAHSGGGVGLVLGGVTEALVRGDVMHTPLAGMGYGAALGWMASAALATQVRPATARVVAVDLGALLGGLGGAALASPLVFGEPTQNQQRAFVGAIGGATLTGGIVAWIVTRPSAKRAPKPQRSYVDPRAQPSRKGRPIVTPRASFGLPTAGILGQSAVGTLRAPVLGMAWQGTLP